MIVYGIALRAALSPERWELLQGFRTEDPKWARAVANWIGSAVARPVRLRIEVIDPFCPHHGS